MAGATAMDSVMDSTQNPRLHLVLDDTRDDGFQSTAVVWSPGNMLQGNLEITCMRGFEIDEAAIFLEGISRNWMGESEGSEITLRVAKAERKFLSQTLDVSLSEIDQVTTAPDGFHLAIPFRFIIASALSGSTTGPPLQCLSLPPSIELGKVFVDDDSGKRYAQPSILYHLRAVVKFAEQEQAPAHTAETSIPIVIMPHTEEFPPTDTGDYPAEFKLRESRMIRWFSLGRSLGAMTISIQEPRALTYSLSSTGASTVGFLHLEVESKSTLNIHPCLQAMSFTVLSLLRIKTFYSIRAFPRVPDQSLLTRYGGGRLRDDMIKLETQNIPNVSWGYTHDVIGDGTIGKATQSDVQSLQSTSKSNPQPPKGKWTTKINYPIRIDSRLLPTFCSAIVARLYSIILRVKVSGIKRESFDLEVPIQVVHPAPDGVSNEAVQYLGAPTGPVGEDPSLLEFRRASATSWFSDESIVSRPLSKLGLPSERTPQDSEESPPRYRP